MAPRAYRLQRRAETAAATRAAIVDAAMATYRDLGVAKATLRAIAERADVSRGTILHHFGDADGLMEAVAERVLELLELPDERILDGITDSEQRLRAFVAAMVAFFRRSTPWWQVFEAEMQRPTLKAREADYFAEIARLHASALGPDLAADPELQAAIGALLYPSTLGSLLWALETGGTRPEAAAAVVEDVVVGFAQLRVKRRERGARTGRANGSARGRGGNG